MNGLFDFLNKVGMIVIVLAVIAVVYVIGQLW